MSTLYEIHVSVNLNSPIDEIRWVWFCKEHKWKSIRVVNDKGENPVQNMIGKWCSRPTVTEAIAHADEIASEIEDGKFDVVRVKAEAMMMNSQFEDTYLTGEKGVYWEFHFKIAIDKMMDFVKLATWKETTELPFRDNIGLSMSTSGETKYPIITLRLSHGTRDEAIQKKDEVIAELKEAGFHIHDKLQAECSVYDTYPEEDAGWIV